MNPKPTDPSPQGVPPKSSRARGLAFQLTAVGLVVVCGLASREEALRVIRGWERLSLRIEGGLAGHRLLN